MLLYRRSTHTPRRKSLTKHISRPGCPGGLAAIASLQNNSALQLELNSQVQSPNISAHALFCAEVGKRWPALAREQSWRRRCSSDAGNSCRQAAVRHRSGSLTRQLWWKVPCTCLEGAATEKGRTHSITMICTRSSVSCTVA